MSVPDGYDPADYEGDPDDDGYQEYKDDLAMGYINEDGSQREPPEPDWEEHDDYGAHRPEPGWPRHARKTAREMRRLRARNGGRTFSVRLGPFEVTFRRRATGSCGACQGRGWFYSVGTVDKLPPPPRCSGVSLCGCASAVDKVNDSRRWLRNYQRRSKDKAPF